MKKMCVLLTIAMGFSMGMMSLPSNGYAVLTALTETGMRQTVAQAGITLTASDYVALDMEIGSMTYKDDDGTDGTAGYLSVNDISCMGSVRFNEPVSITVDNVIDSVSDVLVPGINVSFNGAVIDVDHFDIGSITVGNAPGEGNSFGSISIRGYHAEISGNIRITTH